MSPPFEPLFLAASGLSFDLVESMGPAGHVLQPLLVLGLVLLNAFFVASEFAVVKVRNTQVEEALQQEKRGAKAAKKVVNELDGSLSATQLGITFASIALGAAGEPYFRRLLSDLFLVLALNVPAPLLQTVAFVLSFLFVAYLHVVLGELLPKGLAIRRPLGVTLAISKPLRAFCIIFWPFIRLLNSHANFFMKHVLRVDPVSMHGLALSEEELRVIVMESERGSEVTSTEKDILLNALALNDLTAMDMMTRRHEVVYLDVDKSFRENMAIVLESKHTRFPLVKGSLDEPLGLIHMKDVLPLLGAEDGKEIDLRDIRRELLKVPDNMSADKVLHHFLDRRGHLALVVNEFGTTEGMVTLDNVLEELVGDIHDEFDIDDATLYTRIDEATFLMRASVTLGEFEEIVGIEIVDDDATTVGGCLINALGHLPEKGESAQIGRFLVTAVEADGHRVEELKFEDLGRVGEEGEVASGGNGAGGGK
jgi:CBS domain containing-hemolysin-like protein